MVLGINEKRVVLNKKEIIYIRLFLFGFSIDQMAEYFNKNISYASRLKSTIEFKYNTKDWKLIVSYVFKNEQIKILDYADPLIKTQVLDSIRKKQLAYMLKNRKQLNCFFDLKRDIKQLLDYVKINYRVASFYRTSCEKLTNQEIQLIQLKYKGYNASKIAGELNIRRMEVVTLKNTIFNKLSLHNWIVVFRFALQNGIIKEKGMFDEEKHIEMTVKNILSIIKTNVSLEYILISIYQELLIIITFLEFNTVLTPNYNKQLNG